MKFKEREICNFLKNWKIRKSKKMTGDFSPKKLKKLMKNSKPKVSSADLSKKLLAYGFEIQEESILRYLDDKATPRLSVIYALSQIFGVEIEDFLKGLNKNQKQGEKNAKKSNTAKHINE